MKIIQGIAAAPGVSIGKTLWLREPELTIEQRAASPDVEAERLKQAIDRVKEAVQQMAAGMQDHPEEAAIFEAHLMMLDDPDLLALAQTRLDSGAAYAWDSAIQHYAAQLESLDNEYFRARAADVRDIGQQVLRELLQHHGADLSILTEPVILLARDLTPSDTGRMDKSMVLGFATQEGSATAHTAILAKALGLPAVVGAGEALESIPDGALAVLDGTRGRIVANPDEATKAQYFFEKQQNEETQRAALTHALTPAITTDNHQVEVVANIGNLEDAQEALKQGAEGVGLLRTEFLYLDRKTPPHPRGAGCHLPGHFPGHGRSPGGHPHPGYWRRQSAFVHGSGRGCQSFFGMARHPRLSGPTGDIHALTGGDSIGRGRTRYPHHVPHDRHAGGITPR